MDPQKSLRVMAHVFFWATFAINLLMLFRMDVFNYGPEIAGKYSIYASRGFFMAYHIWGCLLCVAASYSLYKENKLIFLISLLLILILQFYPYFTSSPADKKQAEQELVSPPKDSLTSDSLQK